MRNIDYRKSQDYLIRDEGENKLLYNLVTRQIIILPPHAFRIWELIENKNELNDYLDDFRFEESLISNLIKDFLKKGLIRER